MTITYANSFCFFGGMLIGIAVAKLSAFISAELKAMKEMNELKW